MKKINEVIQPKYSTRSVESGSSDTQPIKAEHAIEIISENAKTYTFKLATKQGMESDPSIYNIVFIEQEDGNFKTVGLMYDFTEEQAEVFHNTGEFDGDVRVVFFDIKNLKNQPHLTTRSASGGNICENIAGGMDCGTLDEVVITGKKGGRKSGGGGGGGFGNGGHTGPDTGGGDAHLLKVSDSGGGGGSSSGYTTIVLDEVIFDPSFEDNDCLMDIYNKMGGSKTFNKYLKEFDKEMSVANLKFSVGVDPDEPDANAITIEPNNYLIEIKFNPNQLDRPSLDVARTFIHEMIHAEMYRELLSHAKQSKIPWSPTFIKSMKNDYPGLYDYYMRFYYDLPAGVSPGDPMHEAMAKHYRGIIVDAMEQYDNSSGNPIGNKGLYEGLAWRGLMGRGLINENTGLPSYPTVVWKNMDQEDRLNILNIYDEFKKNNSKCQE